MLWTPTVAQAVAASQDNAEDIDNSERILEATRAVDYYRSVKKREEDLVSKFEHLFDDKDEWKKRNKSCPSLVRGVADTFCTLYQDPVTRTFPDTPEGDKAAELWAEVEGFDSFMQSVDLYTWLTGTTGARPVWDAEEGKIGFDLYPSAQLDHVPDPRNPRIAPVIILTWDAVERGVSTKIRHFWDAESFAETVDDTIVGDDEYKGTNPYKVIPVRIFRNAPPLWSFYGEVATDLVEANLTLASMLSDLNYTVKVQTHDQLVLEGASDDYVPKLGPLRYIKVPKGGKAYFLGSSADIDKAIAAIDKNLDAFFMSRRIPKSAVVGVLTDKGGGTSGISIVADQAALADYRKQRVNVMRPQEAALIRTTLRVLHFHKTGKIVDFPAPDCDYRELKVPMSVEDRARWDWKILNNLATPIDFLMSENPDLSEEEAEEMYRATAEKNRDLGRLSPPEPGEGADDDDDLEDDDDE